MLRKSTMALSLVLLMSSCAALTERFNTDPTPKPNLTQTFKIEKDCVCASKEAIVSSDDHVICISKDEIIEIEGDTICMPKEDIAKLLHWMDENGQ